MIFSSLVVDRATPLASLARALIVFWLILHYVPIGISFIPNLESFQLVLFNTWGKYKRFRDENQQPRFDRSLFPVIYFFLILVSCAFASLVLLLAVSTFARPSPSLTMVIATVNFVLLFLPHAVLYNQVVRNVYGDEPF